MYFKEIKYFLSVLSVIAVAVTSCTKDGEPIVADKNVLCYAEPYGGAVQFFCTVKSEAAADSVYVLYSQNSDFSDFKSMLMERMDLNKFRVTVSGLLFGKEYYYRFKLCGTKSSYNYDVSDKFVTDDGIYDCEGHIYGFIKIGNDYWMSENLRCATYDTQSEFYGSSMIDYLKCEDKTIWTGDSKYFENITDDIKEKLGYLYSWQSAMGYTEEQAEKQAEEYSGVRQGICPNGWHLPSRAEWNAMENQIGYKNLGAKLMAEKGWYKDIGSVCGTDVYGFKSLPSGYGNENGYVSSIGTEADFWTTAASDRKYAYYRNMYYSNNGVMESNFSKPRYCSVRCVKNKN